MPSIYELIPDHELLLNLEPEELAGIVLEYLNSLSEGSAELNRYNFSMPHTVADYPHEHQRSISRALMEGWVWLEKEGLIAPRPGSQGDWILITRQGLRVGNAKALEAYRLANLLPKQLLHPAIATDAWASFSRGKYGDAVFKAFKEVEVAVREAGGHSHDDFGTDLMRKKAFHPQRGTLTDANQVPAERQATSDLFAGAIGLYKNPHSHRNVSVAADEAAELLIFASHLLRIVDSRTPASKEKCAQS